MADDGKQSLLHEMQAIKTLMMLQLLAMGYKQKDLAGALGVSEATLSRMLPKGLSKKTVVRPVLGGQHDE